MKRTEQDGDAIAARWHGKDKRRPLNERDGGEDDDPRARFEWFYATRRDAEGRPLRHLLDASRTRHKMMAGGTEPAGTPGGPGTVNWTPIGPSVISAFGNGESGRVNAIAAGPGGTRVYAGAANGGVWYSPDGGASWSPLDDYIVSPSLSGGAAEADSLSVGAIAVRFGTSAISDEVYVGTGEANGNYDAYFGIGIRHLVAGSWSLEATNLAGRGIYAITIDPDVPATVLAATTAGIYRRPTSGSMATWTQVTSSAFTSSSGQVSSLIVAGSGATKRYYAAFYGDRVYSSPDGATWTVVPGLSGTGRTQLAVGDSDPTVVYALRGDGTLNRLDSGTFSVVTGLPASALFRGNQGWYDIAIVVDPTSSNTIIVGGDQLALFKGTLTGSAGAWVFPFNAANTSTPWTDPTWVGAGVHSDVHTLSYALDSSGTGHDPTIVWCGSDGGLYLSTGSGGAGTFSSRNLGLATTEFSYLAHRADTDSVVYAGAQDNGTPRLLGEQAAVDSAGGDGGGNACDPTDPYRVIRQYVHASLDATSSLDSAGRAVWTGLNFPPVTSTTTAQTTAAATENGSAGFVAPLAAGGSRLAAFGTNRLWLTADWGATWVTLPTGTNPYVPATPDLAQDVIGGGSVRAITFASPATIFAATSSTIWRYDQTGPTWSRTVLPPLPVSRPITAIAVENATSGTIYVTLGGGGTAHVYYYNGSTWSVAMPQTVVDIPSHAVVVDPANPANVYVGTDVGCFKGVKSGSAWSWSLFSQGLPEAAITDLAIHASSRLLRAATHGRSVWEISLDATTGLDTELYLRVNYNDTARMFGGSRGAWVENHADPTHYDATTPYVLYHWMSADIKVRRSSLTGLPALGSPVSYLDFATNIGDYVDSSVRVETADVSGLDRIFVEVHNRSLNAVPAAQVRVWLLVADASAGLPALPSGYAAQINAGTTGWLGSSGWHFVDPTTPYRTLPGDLDVRTPQVVEYQLDFSTLGLPAGHEHVCLAAFVTAAIDPITATDTNLDHAVLVDRHIAHRNTHLVALGARPGTEPAGDPGGSPGPQTLVIDFHNPGPKEIVADLVFDRTHFHGDLTMMLPKLGRHEPALDGLRVVQHGALEERLRAGFGAWLHRLGELVEDAGDWLAREEAEHERADAKKWKLRKLSKLDRTRSFVAAAGAKHVAVKGVTIPPRGVITAAVTIHAPAGAKHGDRHRLDILQRAGAKIVGGSTYVVAIV
ncbi:MAG: hypothetical protein ACM31C_01645 [Acidobacteriota bacterium]